MWKASASGNCLHALVLRVKCLAMSVQWGFTVGALNMSQFEFFLEWCKIWKCAGKIVPCDRNYGVHIDNTLTWTSERFQERALAGKITNFFELVDEPLPIRWTPAEPPRKNRLSTVRGDFNRYNRLNNNVEKLPEAIAAFFLLALKPTNALCDPLFILCKILYQHPKRAK